MYTNAFPKPNTATCRSRPGQGAVDIIQLELFIFVFQPLWGAALRVVCFCFSLRLWIRVVVSFCGSGPPHCVRTLEDKMEMCKLAGENCTGIRKGEVQLHKSKGIGYKFRRKLRFFWDPFGHIPPWIHHAPPILSNSVHDHRRYR